MCLAKEFGLCRIQRRTARNLTERRTGPRAAVGDDGAIDIALVAKDDGTLPMCRAAMVGTAGHLAGGKDPGSESMGNMEGENRVALPRQRLRLGVSNRKRV
jgi:hypothetical protein